MSVLARDFVRTSCQPLIAFTHISQLILVLSLAGCVTTITGSQNPQRSESRRYSDCKSPGLKSHWLHRGYLVYAGTEQTLSSRQCSAWSPLGQRCFKWCVVWSGASIIHWCSQVLRTTKHSVGRWGYTCSRSFQLVLGAFPRLPELRAAQWSSVARGGSVVVYQRHIPG